MNKVKILILASIFGLFSAIITSGIFSLYFMLCSIVCISSAILINSQPNIHKQDNPNENPFIQSCL